MDQATKTFVEEVHQRAMREGTIAWGAMSTDDDIVAIMGYLPERLRIDLAANLKAAHSAAWFESAMEYADVDSGEAKYYLREFRAKKKEEANTDPVGID